MSCPYDQGIFPDFAPLPPPEAGVHGLTLPPTALGGSKWETDPILIRGGGYSL